MNESHVPADERPTETRSSKRAEAVAKARERAHPKAITALEKALTQSGGNVGLSAALREVGCAISPQAISQWIVVPMERVLLVERATGVPRYDLRPDFYPAPVLTQK